VVRLPRLVGVIPFFLASPRGSIHTTGLEAKVGRRSHAVEAVPCEDGAPAVAYALGHVAAFVVAVAGVGLIPQEVI